MIIDPDTARRVLALPVPGHGEDTTIRDYLTDLAGEFWNDRASSKYGFTGDSGWRYHLYEPLRDAGLIPAWVDGYGVGYRTAPAPGDIGRGLGRHDEDQELADALITAAIRELGSGEVPAVVHALKTAQPYYDAIESGMKTFDIRVADRPFRVGDHLVLREYVDGSVTGRVEQRVITYVMDDPDYVLPGSVVLGIRAPKLSETLDLDDYV